MPRHTDLANPKNFMASLHEAAKDGAYQQFCTRYQNDRVGFVRDCFVWRDGQQPAFYQNDLLRQLDEGCTRLSWRGPRGARKCVAYGEEILLSDGRYKRVESLIGRHFGVLTMTESGQLKPTIAFAQPNGVEPVFRVKTCYGREFLRTGNHPLLTFEGWKDISELSSGNLVAMPTELPVEGGRPIPEIHIKILAYLIGDGHLGHGSRVSFSQADGPSLDEFLQCIDAMGCMAVKNGYDYRIVSKANHGKGGRIYNYGKNAVAELVKEYGLMGKNSYQKRIPEKIFELPNNQVALFLSRLFATDGWASSTADDKKHATVIGICSVSEQLVRDVQRLALRLGIIGAIRKQKTTWTHKGVKSYGCAWHWTIQASHLIVKFADEIGIYGKESAVEKCRAKAMRRCGQQGTSNLKCQRWPKQTNGYIGSAVMERGEVQRDFWKKMGVVGKYKTGPTVTTPTVERCAEYLNDAWLTKLVNARVGWDTIVSIEPVGEMETVAITVPGTENYVCDVFEHNTSTVAWIVLHFALTRDGNEGRDWKVGMTASVGRQLTEFLWPEIRKKWLPRLKWDVIGREPFKESKELPNEGINLQRGKVFSFVSNDPDKIEGIHADDVLIIFDESKAVPQKSLDAVMDGISGAGADTDQNATIIAVSTPGEPAGWFYDLHTNHPRFAGWSKVHITQDMCIKAGALSVEGLKEVELRCGGKNTARYKQQALGEFAADDVDGIIHLSWIEKAIERGYEIRKNNGFGAVTSVGVDVSDGGKDSTVLAPCHGKHIGDLIKISRDGEGSAMMAEVGRVGNWLDQHDMASPVCVVDRNGAGSGFAQRLEERASETKANWTVERFVSQEAVDKRVKAPNGVKAGNRRALGYLILADLLNPENKNDISLPDDPQLLLELSLVKRKPEDSQGRVFIQEKTLMKKELGVSPDRADAVMQALSANRTAIAKKKIVCFSTGDDDD